MAKYPKPDLTKRHDRGGYYYFRYYHPKPGGGYSRPNIATPFKDEPRALKFAEDYIRKAIDGKAPEPVVMLADLKPVVLLTDRVGWFIRSKYTNKKADNTIVSVAGNLARMIKYLGTNDRDAVTPELALKAYDLFQTTKNKQNRFPNAKGVDHWIKDVCRYWDWEVSLKGVSDNPFRGEHITRPKSEDFYVADEIWTPQEALDVWQGLEDQEDRDAFWWMRWSAMYQSDTFEIDAYKHVVTTPGLGILKLREKSTSKKQVIKLPISEVTMPSHVIGIFTDRLSKLNGKRRVFCHHYKDDKGQAWSEAFNYRVASVWRRLYPNTKPKNVKSLRHTRTTEWIEAGIDPDVIGTWLGHVDGSKMVLAIYAHRRALKAFANPSPLLLANPAQGQT